ncbi:hypothetical protein [Acinetobacter baumannii]|nr:hypothetical protein [Acinetobacter baumannii]
MTDDIKKLELKPDTEYWPDPFDQKEQFKQMLEDDGLKLPLALRGAA